MSDKLKIHVGDKIKAIMPWSEVCMHLGVAGKTMTCEILSRGVQLYDENGTKFSFPISHGEAGFYDGTQLGDTETSWYTLHPQSDVADCIQELRNVATAWEKVGVDEYAVEELRYLTDKLEAHEKKKASE